MSSLSNEIGYRGFQEPNTSSSDFNSQTFMVWAILARVRTMEPVKIISVTNSGGISPVGFVDIQPLVNQVDGVGNAVPHGTIYHCPYIRLQGGANAIILDPQVGDIGFAGFADRDISSVAANKAQANPGSRRMFDMADAVYMGGMLNGTPTQYIAFSSSGITVTSPTKINLNAPIVEVDAPSIILNGALQQGSGSNAGNATMGGTLTVQTDVALSNGTTLGTHTHPGVQSGSNNTGTPNNN